MFVVVDGRKVGAEYSDIAEPIAISADGRRMAFAARRGSAHFVVVDEKEERAYAGIAAESLGFGPTGRDLIYASTKDANKHVVVVSGLEGREFDAVGLRGPDCRLSQRCGVLFDSDGSFRYLARLSDRIYLVRNWAVDR